MSRTKILAAAALAALATAEQVAESAATEFGLTPSEAKERAFRLFGRPPRHHGWGGSGRGTPRRRRLGIPRRVRVRAIRRRA